MVMVFSSKHPIILLILSYTLTTKFALELLRHVKHVQAKRKHTLSSTEQRGWAACRQGSAESTIQALPEHEEIFILQSKFPNSQNLSLKKIKP